MKGLLGRPGILSVAAWKGSIAALLALDSCVEVGMDPWPSGHPRVIFVTVTNLDLCQNLCSESLMR